MQLNRFKRLTYSRQFIFYFFSCYQVLFQVSDDDVHGEEDPDTATLSKKFSFFEKGGDVKKKSEVGNHE